MNVEQMIIKFKEQSRSREPITTNQLRKILSNTLVVSNKIKMLEMEDQIKDNKLPKEIINDINTLKVRHIYQCARDKKVKDFDDKAKIKEKLASIGDDLEKFKEFHRYIEEIVAYVKYYLN